MNLFPALVVEIERNPGLLLQARDTLGYWEKNQLAPKNRMEEWRTILDKAIQSEAGRRALNALLLDESEAAKRIKDFAPFAGLLPRETRRKVFSTCVYDH
ncbi:MAG TPA: hypothetical protein PKE26_03990 [Kiritimatiellia bacterium]|nr:hypothetical protein [Kiritimatiellia bacterium]HMO98250.1 hypothetical protein [Kiritimatiellia bacterium]HMP96595.1 hypothetical protein [Kiritimatiellia bacterium]